MESRTRFHFIILLTLIALSMTVVYIRYVVYKDYVIKVEPLMEPVVDGESTNL